MLARRRRIGQQAHPGEKAEEHQAENGDEAQGEHRLAVTEHQPEHGHHGGVETRDRLDHCGVNAGKADARLDPVQGLAGLGRGDGRRRNERRLRFYILRTDGLAPGDGPAALAHGRSGEKGGHGGSPFGVEASLRRAPRHPGCASWIISSNGCFR